LLTALLRTFSGGRNTPLLIDLEGHGRETDTLDLSQTVGWFTSIFPVCLQLDGQESGALIKSVKEQLRQIPQKGLGYGVLRYLNPETGSQLAKLPRPEIRFNYAGQLETATSQSLGGEWAEAENLGYLFDINAAIVNEQVSITWRYSQKLYRRDTVESLAGGFVRALQVLISHCQVQQTGGYTPGDFPLCALTQAELDRLIGRGTNVADIYPLSPMQAGMLFHNLYAPDSGVYYIQTCMQISGTLDVPLSTACHDRHTSANRVFLAGIGAVGCLC
jgi:non-ribosomal peptide synthase protein (TIGR01720 family)